jgi:formylglycine-generating enzyme required for sulfatase activity
MRRRLLIAGVLLLAGVLTVLRYALTCPPLRFIQRYGLSPGCEPTGRTKTLEGVEFVEVGPGCSRMGSDRFPEGGDSIGRLCASLRLPWGEHPEPSDEMPVHWVEFRRGFWIARTELTNEQYERSGLAHRRDPVASGDRDPAAHVSWMDARRYCRWLSTRSGLPIRLPSEAEWECACRAGGRTAFCFGNDEDLLQEHAWFRANAQEKAHKVATRRANAWGLFDLHGNLAEWCEDSWHDGYEGAPEDGTAWTVDASGWINPGIRVVRGGSWDDIALDCRSAYRNFGRPGYRGDDHGLRPAFTLPEGEER